MTRSSLRNAALTCATQWQWPVLPGAALTPTTPATGKPGATTAERRAEHAGDDHPGTERAGRERTGAERSGPERERPEQRQPEQVHSEVHPEVHPEVHLEQVADGPPLPPLCCSCGDPGCVVPGAHPLDPVLLAATTDARMVRWWWTNRPSAPLILATGGRAPCALSLPAVAGTRALAEFARTGIRLGPVVATATRFTFLVAPYRLEELGDLLYAHDWVPSSLRFHGEGGYVALPPSPTVAGQLRWERPPVAERGAGGAPWLPRMQVLLDALVEASATTPDTGSTLAY